MPPNISYRYSDLAYPVVPDASSTLKDMRLPSADFSVRQSVMPYCIPVHSAQIESKNVEARVLAEGKAAYEQADESLDLPKHDKATRMAALLRMRELWQESGNGYVDGVEYQEEMRSEWR